LHLLLFSVLFSHLVLHLLSAVAAVVTAAAAVEVAFTEVVVAFMAVVGRTVEADITVAKEPIAAVKEDIAAAKEVFGARVARVVLTEGVILAAAGHKPAAVRRKQIAPQIFIPPSTTDSGTPSATVLVPRITPRELSQETA
jgi:hypothetical protein